MKPEEHEHEPGEDTSRCANCNLAREIAALDEFELAAWNWYRVNVSPFTMQSGFVGQMFMREAPKAETERKFWVMALNAIYETMTIIEEEQRQKANSG